MRTDRLNENPEQIQHEKARRRLKIVRNMICVLIVVAAVTVLVSTYVLPVLRIHGSSMTPTVEAGQIIMAKKGGSFKTGDIIAFWYGNKVLVKRVIGTENDVVDIDKEGRVYINNELLDEPYIPNPSLGECNIALPTQVPENRYFVMGDHRAVSQDSRNMAVGFIDEDQIIGRITLRLWPLNKFGAIE